METLLYTNKCCPFFFFWTNAKYFSFTNYCIIL